MNDLSEFVDDFTSSEHFLFITGSIKEYAEQLLLHFTRHCPQPVTLPAVEQTMFAMARLDLPLSVRTDVPELLTSFFNYLGTSGKFPAASGWESYPALIKPAYASLFRDDGSVRGTTYKKEYSPTGRNAPCPCGSGIKFKKCCGRT